MRGGLGRQPSVLASSSAAPALIIDGAALRDRRPSRQRDHVALYPCPLPVGLASVAGAAMQRRRLQAGAAI
jgi:hypothetical protein